MGGGSSVNGQVALRGVPSRLRRMGAARAPPAGAGATACRTFAGSSATWISTGRSTAATGRLPIRRTFPKDWGGFALAFRDAAAEAGLPYYDDANAEPGDGCFPFPRNNVYGRRVSTAIAYLDNATRLRPNLHVVPHALVERIEFDGRRRGRGHAHGGGRPVRLEAREIIVSAGAIHSPALLMRSGIGPAEHLRDARHPSRAPIAWRRGQSAGSPAGRARRPSQAGGAAAIRRCATPS